MSTHLALTGGARQRRPGLSVQVKKGEILDVQPVLLGEFLEHGEGFRVIEIPHTFFHVFGHLFPLTIFDFNSVFMLEERAGFGILEVSSFP
jgi:hypothetical protein